MKQLRNVSLCLCVAVSVLGSVVAGDPFEDPYNYDYTYGDYKYHYEGEPPAAPSLHAESHMADPANFVDEPEGKVVPLCCPPNTVRTVFNNCSNPPESWTWKPYLSGEIYARFYYKGFPRCKTNDPIPFYQKEIFFSKSGEAFLPHYVQLDPVPQSKYCVSKFYDNNNPEECEMHQTKVFACLEKKQPEAGLYWTGVGVAHLLLFLTLLAFFFVRDLRCLQGQYMICFLISLLLYNICLLPGSVLSLDISFVSCVSLGAVKYFFFCGVMLWFNVICFDIWRTLKNRQDVGSRKRFLLYSVYTWVVGAVLTTVVLVTPYATGKDHDTSLMEAIPGVCKLKTDINMILQLVETLLMVVNFIFIALATSNTCKYPKFGNGLPRCEASLCLKQGWKLFIIMIGHTLIDVPDDILDIRLVDLWRYVLIESLAIFAVFAYRKTVLKTLYRCFCRAPCYHPDEEMSSVQEKDQLTTMH